jgi:hypothetical protein
MDKTSIISENQRKSTIVQNTDIILHCLLAVLLLFTGVIGWIDWHIIQSTFIGMLVAAVGGTVLGMVALRYLGESRSNRETLFGLVVTVGLGVLTIGYLYIFYIKGPMKSIGTLNRMVKQTFIFLEFLFAHISGIRLGKRFKR